MHHARPRTKAGLIEADGQDGRLCAVTRAEKDPEELIRFVAGPDGTIAPDLARKLPGRGVWVSSDRATVAEATARGVFAKSLKKQVKVPPDLADLVERLLLERCRSGLSFAKKAGLVTQGYMKVDAAISAGEAVGLVQAADGADDGVERLGRKFTGITTQLGLNAQIVRELTSAELSLAIGRANVIHAALAEGGQTRRFLADCLRLHRYRHGIGERPQRDRDDASCMTDGRNNAGGTPGMPLDAASGGTDSGTSNEDFTVSTGKV